VGFLDRLFGKRSAPVADSTTGASSNAMGLPSMGDIQTDAEKAAVRQTMEADLDAQRARRAEKNAPNA
jgi:hypothetical protein